MPPARRVCVDAAAIRLRACRRGALGLRSCRKRRRERLGVFARTEAPAALPATLTPAHAVSLPLKLEVDAHGIRHLRWWGHRAGPPGCGPVVRGRCQRKWPPTDGIDPENAKSPATRGLSRCAEEDSNLHPVVPDQALNLVTRVSYPSTASRSPESSLVDEMDVMDDLDAATSQAPTPEPPSSLRAAVRATPEPSSLEHGGRLPVPSQQTRPRRAGQGSAESPPLTVRLLRFGV